MSVFNWRQCCILWDFSAALRSSTNPSIYSYEARNGASLVQSFKYNFSFPSMYRRLKAKANLKRDRKSNGIRDSQQINLCSQRDGPIGD